ncbi:MAG: hypothetical protein AAF215_29560 [Cyanobacteria bacterium P01_A01_bin.123]
MLSQTYYLLRSQVDGQYLVARPRIGETPSSGGFLMLFAADYDALSYVNAHGAEVASQFKVETLAGTQLKPLLDRWGFEGIGLVKDPLVPQVEFMRVT